jgi:hypothetical protein
LKQWKSILNVSIFTLIGLQPINQLQKKLPIPTLIKNPTMTAQARVNTGLPVRLRIPSLKIDTLIMGVGLTRTGDMDVPRSGSQVGWYALGARPSY